MASVRLLPLLVVGAHRRFLVGRFSKAGARLAVFVERLADAARATPRTNLDAVWWAHFGLWVANGVQTWLILQLSAERVDLFHAVALDSLAAGARLLFFFVPGGLGVQEGALIYFGAMFGLPADAALALSLTRRARDLFIKIFVAAVSSALLLRRRGERPKTAD